MLLAADTFALGPRIGDARAVELYADAGFDAIDFSLDELSNPESFLATADGAEHAEKLRKVADARGIAFVQGHAPFRFDWNRPGEIEGVAIHRIVRSFELAAILGMGTMIVHPLHHWPYRGDEKRILAANHEYYLSLLPHAKKHGVVIALENMFQTDSGTCRNGHDVFSRPDEFAEALDRLPAGDFTACVDVGHCACCGVDPADMIRRLGKKRLGNLHVHDNDGLEDRHWSPYFGCVDWDAVTGALADIEYEGDFSLETLGFWNGFPDDFLKPAAAFLHSIGRNLIEKIRRE